MKLENYEVHLPSYSIGSIIYDKIGPVCESYGKTVLVIGGEKAFAAAYDKIKAAVDETNLVIIGKEIFGKDCTYQTVERLRSMKLYQLADMVFGVGGGKALDIVKSLCITDDKPVFTFPTIASNCAACTSVSIMYNEDGTFLKPHFFIRPAMHAFIDTEIIAKAPYQYLWAGIGDTYAKYYEATISSRDERLEHFTSLGVALSKCAVTRCWNTVRRRLQTTNRNSVLTMWSRLSWRSSSQRESLRFSLQRISHRITTAAWRMPFSMH